MADVTLTPAEVDAYGLGTVSQTDIDDASNVLVCETGFTPTEHRDIRNIPEGSVKRAWAIMSARLRDQTLTPVGGDPTTESQGDYSYGRNDGLSVATALYPDLLAGPVRVLLCLPLSVLTRANHTLPYRRRDDGHPGTIDDFGTWFPPPP